MQDPKISKKRLAEELETLRHRLKDIEEQVEDTLGEAAVSARRKVRQLVGNEPVSEQEREHLIRALAQLKSERRGDDQAITHWLEAEEEIDLILELLQLQPQAD